MTGMAVNVVDYGASARRHFQDAEMLFASNRAANAGQLYGFVAECGVKAMLVACRVPTDQSGSIKFRDPFRQHVPKLMDSVNLNGALIPDGRFISTYLAFIPGISALNDWSVDHRYWKDEALPSASVTAWKSAAIEVLSMLDEAAANGVLT
jgi:hypothetical protein